MNGPPSLATIQSALHDWTTARSLLSTAVRTYIATCTTLNTLCTQPGYLAPEKSLIEDTLAKIDSHLAWLSSDALALDEARIMMCSLRNMSKRLAPVSRLPPEVLAHVLKYATPFCLRDENRKRHYNILTAVSAYWRQTALNTPELWTHVDICPQTVAQGSWNLANLSVERAKKSLLDMHLRYVEGGNMFVGWEDSYWRQFITAQVPRIGALTLELDDFSLNFVLDTLELWEPDHSSTLKELSIYYNGSMHVLSLEESLAHFSSMGTLSPEVLRVWNVRIPWTDAIVCNLKELHLRCTSRSLLRIFSAEFAHFLANSPRLTTLNLEGVLFLRNTDAPKPSIVISNHLKMLSLVQLMAYGPRIILPIISQPDPAARLSVRLTHHRRWRDVYQTFYSLCYIHVLHFECETEDLAFDDLPASLNHLVVSRSDFIGLSYTCDTDMLTQSYRCIPHVTLISCLVTLDDLLILIDTLGVKQLRLDLCILDRLMGPDGIVPLVPKELEKEVTHARPGVTCVVSDVDSSLSMPCTNVF